MGRDRRRRLASGRTYAACSIAAGSKSESSAVSVDGSSFHSGSSWSVRTAHRGGSSETTSGRRSRRRSAWPGRAGAPARPRAPGRGRTRQRAARLGRAGARGAGRGGGVTEKRSQRGAGEEHDAGREGERAENDRARIAHEPLEQAVEDAAELAAVLRAEQEQQPERATTTPVRNGRTSTRPERATIEPAHAEQRERQREARGADQPVEPRRWSSSRPRPRPSRGGGRPRGTARGRPGPSPTSSGWAAPLARRPLRFFTRDGVRGRTLWGAFFRAIGAYSPALGALLLGGEGAQVVDRAVVQVLAQVEEPGPERGALRRRAHRAAPARPWRARTRTASSR